MSHDDGWIVESGTSIAHYRQDNRKLCRPIKRLRGVHLAKAMLPAERCEMCMERLDEEMASDRIG